MTSPKLDPLADLPWPKPEQPRAEISAKICGECTKNLCPARKMSSAMRLALSIVASGAVASVGFWFGTRHHRSELGLRMGVYGALAWALVQAGVLFLGLAPRRGPLGSRTLRIALAALVPISFLVYLSFAAWSYVPFEQFSHGARASRLDLWLGSVVLRGGRRRQCTARLAQDRSADASLVRDVGGARRGRRGRARHRHRLSEPRGVALVDSPRLDRAGGGVDGLCGG